MNVEWEQQIQLHACPGSLSWDTGVIMQGAERTGRIRRYMEGFGRIGGWGRRAGRSVVGFLGG